MIIYIEIHPYACGINRIRLEFKAERRRRGTEPHRVLIESDWNLKEVPLNFDVSCVSY